MESKAIGFKAAAKKWRVRQQDLRLYYDEDYADLASSCLNTLKKSQKQVRNTENSGDNSLNMYQQNGNMQHTTNYSFKEEVEQQQGNIKGSFNPTPQYAPQQNGQVQKVFHNSLMEDNLQIQRSQQSLQTQANNGFTANRQQTQNQQIVDVGQQPSLIRKRRVKADVDKVQQQQGRYSVTQQGQNSISFRNSNSRNGRGSEERQQRVSQQQSEQILGEQQQQQQTQQQQSQKVRKRPPQFVLPQYGCEQRSSSQLSSQSQEADQEFEEFLKKLTTT
eukprot:TRINITY_DN16332_c0_g1_i1.p1 TRINITY_DN16332_c0_g1~~TRINITY_DN16332_c0_g1_i1.p1  ORF type:complete len:276 (-),score=28.78 TRINITY_DN16332_c0_g1_i1:376-1203(-)